jgi:hypothetical protein
MDMQEALLSKEALNPDESNQMVERKILQAVKGLRYGSVEITIHDSKAVQIERKERIRFDRR